jgi:hypothetical protein
MYLKQSKPQHENFSCWGVINALPPNFTRGLLEPSFKSREFKICFALCRAHPNGSTRVSIQTVSSVGSGVILAFCRVVALSPSATRSRRAKSYSSRQYLKVMLRGMLKGVNPNFGLVLNCRNLGCLISVL